MKCSSAALPFGTNVPAWGRKGRGGVKLNTAERLGPGRPLNCLDTSGQIEIGAAFLIEFLIGRSAPSALP